MTKIVGILNITPDSFSDGGVNFDLTNALNNVGKMVETGVDVIEVGGESTRPNAYPLSPEEEWNRIEPILKSIAPLVTKGVSEVSIDSYHKDTIIKAMESGVNFINNVSANYCNYTLALAKERKSKLVLMHNMGIPTRIEVVVSETSNHIKLIQEWFEQKIDILLKQGIEAEQIILDPGIGFGKTAKQSIDIIKNIECFKKLGVKTMVGHSRKSFLSLASTEPSQNRDIETIAISSYLILKSVDYIRIHDYINHSRILRTLNLLKEQDDG